MFKKFTLLLGLVFPLITFSSDADLSALMH